MDSLIFIFQPLFNYKHFKGRFVIEYNIIKIKNILKLWSHHLAFISDQAIT